jgi:hypothetical protein
MPDKLEFEVILQKPRDFNTLFSEVPFDTVSIFGKKSRIAVKGTIDGVEILGSIVPMNTGNYHHCFGLSKELRQRIGKSAGDVVLVCLSEDTEERKVEIPEDFGIALEDNQEAKKNFNKISYTHKKEYIRWIIEAKKPETRIRRIEKTIEQLLDQ